MGGDDRVPARADNCVPWRGGTAIIFMGKREAGDRVPRQGEGGNISARPKCLRAILQRDMYGASVAEMKDKNSQETLPSMVSASSKMLLRGSTNSSYMSTGGDNTWSSDDSEDEDTTRSQPSTVEIKAIAKKVLKESERL